MKFVPDKQKTDNLVVLLFCTSSGDQNCNITIYDVSAHAWLSCIYVKTFFHTEYNCEAFLLGEYVCVFSSLLLERMLLYKLCICEAFLWCEFGYVQSRYLI